MECHEKGYLTKDDSDGLKVKWGNAESTRQLLYMIVHRQGIGNLLAEGVMRASKKVGRRSSEMCDLHNEGKHSKRP